MVLGGMTYEAPLHLLLSLLSVYQPFSSRCLSPPSSRIDSRLNFHSLSALFFPLHLSLAELLLFTILILSSPPLHMSPSITSALCLFYAAFLVCFPDLPTPLSQFHCLTFSAPLISKIHSCCSYAEQSRTI